MIDELNFAIDKAKCTTPGIDGISIGILRYLPAVSRLVLLHIFNIIWDRGDCPSKWKEAVLTPLAKPGKDPPSPFSYRPITLTASICKVMERMINNRLQWFLEENNFISNVQSDFRTGRRTIDHLTHLESTINMGRENTLAVFLDLEKAYDMVWRKEVLIKMQGMELCGRIIRWIDSFLTNHYIRVIKLTVISLSFVILKMAFRKAVSLAQLYLISR